MLAGPSSALTVATDWTEGARGAVAIAYSRADAGSPARDREYGEMLKYPDGEPEWIDVEYRGLTALAAKPG